MAIPRDQVNKAVDRTILAVASIGIGALGGVAFGFATKNASIGWLFGLVLATVASLIAKVK